MEALADLIRQHRNCICQELHIGYANWDDLLQRLEHQENRQQPDFADEQVWTFLVACAYSIRGLTGTERLAQLLVESNQHISTRAWFEVLPLPPREGEGNTHLDLAFGNIALREGTQSGIELGTSEQSLVSFVECKWYSDIANSVTYDPHRNQLARVIENAMYFNRNNQFAREVHVTVVTPQLFMSAVRSRLYQYKYHEYNTPDRAGLERDLAASCLPQLWQSENINDRLSVLHLHWVSYESLFMNIPDSVLRLPLLDFARRFNGTQENQ